MTREKPEYVDSYCALQEQLTDILQGEDAYDPRPEYELEEVEEVAKTGSLDVNAINNQIADALKKDENNQGAQTIISLNPVGRVNGPLSVNTTKDLDSANQEQHEANAVKEINSPQSRTKSPSSPSKRKHHAKKPTVKPLY